MFTYYLDSLKTIKLANEEISHEIYSTIVEICYVNFYAHKILTDNMIIGKQQDHHQHNRIIFDLYEVYIEKTGRLTNLFFKFAQNNVYGIQALTEEELFKLKRDLPLEVADNLDNVRISVKSITETERSAISAFGKKVSALNKAVLEEIKRSDS